MKKIISLFIITIIIIGSYYFYNNIYIPNQIKIIEPEKNKVTITKYYIYGTHLNIEGNIKKINAKFKKIDLVFYNIKTGKQEKTAQRRGNPEGTGENRRPDLQEDSK